jgi:hypothetical protein
MPAPEKGLDSGHWPGTREGREGDDPWPHCRGDLVVDATGTEGISYGRKTFWMKDPIIRIPSLKADR